MLPSGEGQIVVVVFFQIFHGHGELRWLRGVGRFNALQRHFEFALSNLLLAPFPGPDKAVPQLAGGCRWIGGDDLCVSEDLVIGYQ
ncbi:hypothetical protein D3C85_1749370 [compost metagenome]